VIRQKADRLSWDRTHVQRINKSLRSVLKRPTVGDSQRNRVESICLGNG